MKLFSAHQSRCSTIPPCALMTGVTRGLAHREKGRTPAWSCQCGDLPGSTLPQYCFNSAKQPRPAPHLPLVQCPFCAKMLDDLLLDRRLDLLDLSQAINALVDLSRIGPIIPRT